MSKTIMAEIAAHSQAKGHRQLVLLRLAYYADNEGRNAYPSMLTIADQTGITERHVQRCIKALEANGHIAVERQKEPGKNPRNIYTILRPWHTAQKSTDNTSVVQAIPAQKSTDMCTDMCTDQMSVDPKEDPEEKKPHACVREDEENRQPPRFPDHPDDLLTQLDTATLAHLEHEARRSLEQEGVKAFALIKPVIHARMVFMWTAKGMEPARPLVPRLEPVWAAHEGEEPLWRN
jgi:hypothetical protein